MFVKRQRLRTQYQSTTHQLIIHHPFTGTFTGTFSGPSREWVCNTRLQNSCFVSKTLRPLLLTRTPLSPVA